MDEIRANAANTYHIRIRGVLTHPLADWLGDIQVLPQEHHETLLVGQFTDQAALRGLLDQLWNLNFTILSLERIGNERPET